MTAMRLFWSSRSPYVRKVMIAAHEAGLADDIACVAATVSPTVLDETLAPYHPLGQIPTLVLADGTALYDSVVICDYLSRHSNAARLIPNDEPGRTDTLRRQALGDGLNDKAILWRAEVLRPEALRWITLIGGLRARIFGALDLIEREFAQGSALSFDLGGIAVAAALSYLDFRFIADPWRAGRPQLAHWFDEIKQRPSMRATEFHD